MWGAWLIGILATAHLVLAPKFADTWWFDITTNFRPYQWGVIVLCAGAVLWRFSRLLGLLAILTVVTVALGLNEGLQSKFLPQARELRETPPALALRGVQVLSFNLLSTNPMPEHALDWVFNEALSGDAATRLIFLMEVTPDWIPRLAALRTKFPHHIELPRDDNFGFALYSSVPLNRVFVRPFDDKSNVPGLTGQIPHGKDWISIIGVHPVPPVNARFFQARNEYLGHVRELIGLTPGPVLAFGDFNCSRWSPHWAPFENLGLQNAFGGLFPPATWYTFRGLVRTHVDHVLFSPHFAVKKAEVSGFLGSDHRALKVEF